MSPNTGLPAGRRPKHSTTKLSDLLHQARDTGLRQYQIAGICNIHPTTLGKYAAGTKPIPANALVALSKFFDVTPKDVVGGSYDGIY